MGGSARQCASERIQKKTDKEKKAINCAVLEKSLCYALVVCLDVFVVSFNERHVELLFYASPSLLYDRKYIESR